jgi:hypothetical protein
MQTSKEWIEYFSLNLIKQRIDWSLQPCISVSEKENIISSLKAWQLGETSDGKNLIAATKKYAEKFNDYEYLEAIKLFIKEEQKHGNNLGRWLDLIGEKRLQKNWGDTLFRKIRHLNHSMECWTITVITVETAAQLYYQALKNATACPLLKEICTDILVDEAFHIQFQLQRLKILHAAKTAIGKKIRHHLYKLFYVSVIQVIWMDHKKVFIAGGYSYSKYNKLMTHKFSKTIAQLAMADLAPGNFTPASLNGK